LPYDFRFYGRIIGVACPYIIFGIGLFAYYIKKNGYNINKAYWKYIIKYGFPLVVGALSMQLLSGSDKIMLQKIKSNSTTGIYSIAYNFANVLFSI
jgi:O-antigen/teichoic acid export membrane protein